MRKKLERKCKQSVGDIRKAYKGNDTNALSGTDVGYSPWGSKNRISSKNSCE